jgi:hypothetical protein
MLELYSWGSIKRILYSIGLSTALSYKGVGSVVYYNVDN